MYQFHLMNCNCPKFCANDCSKLNFVKIFISLINSNFSSYCLVIDIIVHYFYNKVAKKLLQ